MRTIYTLFQTFGDNATRVPVDLTAVVLRESPTELGFCTRILTVVSAAAQPSPEADNEDFHGSLGPLETGNYNSKFLFDGN